MLWGTDDYGCKDAVNALASKTDECPAACGAPIVAVPSVSSIATLEPGPNDFALRLTVATSQPLPLKLKNFKAQGVTTKLNASPNPYEDYTEFDDFGAQK